jgi:hypothetical protein
VVVTDSPVPVAKIDTAIWKSPSPKSLFVDKYENDTHAPVYYQYDTYVVEFHKKRKMYTLSVADK